MKLNKYHKKISLILSICMILVAFLSVGLVLAHAGHNCMEHQTEEGCDVCLQIENVLELCKKLAFINMCIAIFMMAISTHISDVLPILLGYLKPTPITLKVKMIN